MYASEFAPCIATHKIVLQDRAPVFIPTTTKIEQSKRRPTYMLSQKLTALYADRNNGNEDNT